MKKGFTLIELLVVVLIIGILSAVALPQYQKAVNRAKAAEAWTLGKAFVEAEMVYYLETGSATSDLSALDITLPTELKNWEMLMGGPVWSGIPGDVGSSWMRLSGKGSLEDIVLEYHFNRSPGIGEMNCSPSDLCRQMMPCSDPEIFSSIGSTGITSYTYSCSPL